ncbi:MAG TPA: SDR family NAD(P)-dependent oxidoreductase [Thermomicrobiales bacterium]|nr:SDR family NAD(P)-dependent oxidoreductase [Thermomicrobiales bacterium]
MTRRRILIAVEMGVKPAQETAGSLTGMTALVTGAGSGIGQAAARALSAAGARVVVTELPDRLERAEATVSELERAGGPALAVALDVRDLESISDCVDAAARAGDGRLDILVNNAGVNVRQPAFEVTEEAWDLVLDTNLKGLFFTAQTAGRVMRDQVPPGGSIVNVSSVVGLVGYYDRAAYCSSKAGVINLSRVLAIEWAPYHIRVNAVCPTFVETPLTRVLLENEAIKSDILGRTPAGRLATPEEVAAAVTFLAGPATAMITGTALTVDGGWTAI